MCAARNRTPNPLIKRRITSSAVPTCVSSAPGTSVGGRISRCRNDHFSNLRATHSTCAGGTDLDSGNHAGPGCVLTTGRRRPYESARLRVRCGCADSGHTRESLSSKPASRNFRPIGPLTLVQQFPEPPDLNRSMCSPRYSSGIRPAQLGPTQTSPVRTSDRSKAFRCPAARPPLQSQQDTRPELG